MPARPLFQRHPLGLQTTYSELKQRAFEQEILLLGTPGSVSERTESGSQYFYRQFYDSEAAKAAEYIGPVDDAEAAERARVIRERIADANELASMAQLLSTVGYVQVDARTQAVLVVLANADLFRGGGMVVGSHAYGALLNDLGVKITPFMTEDIDIARSGPLTIATGKALSFADLLRTSRVPLLPIPSLDRKGPATSFAIPPRLRGKRRLRVDLLSPVTTGEARPVSVPELGAHAMGLPHFRFLLDAPLYSIVLGKNAVVPVKVPRPERLAWHKVLTSELRSETSDKKQKDLGHAAVLFAVLSEDAPESLVRAHGALSVGSRKKVAAGLPALLQRLTDAGHARAVELVNDVTGRKAASKKR